jgi:hypothetical protein
MRSAIVDSETYRARFVRFLSGAAFSFILYIMKARQFMLIAAAIGACLTSASAQSILVINDPTKTAPETKMTAAEEAIFTKSALPTVRKQIPKETCEEDISVAGVARGTFSRAGARQSLIFYQYCQTGNGFGWVGLVLIDGDKVVGNYVSDGGWSVSIERVADVNQDGLDEFTLHYSGGLHQGHGGVGVDLMEFAGGKPVGIGWYKAEEYDDTDATSVWKLTALPGVRPVFYKQKYSAADGKNYRRVGANAVTRLGKAFCTFEAVK